MYILFWQYTTFWVFSHARPSSVTKICILGLRGGATSKITSSQA